MNFFLEVRDRIFLVFAYLFKIQSNWFFEIISIVFSIAIVGGLIWLVFEVKKHVRKRKDRLEKYWHWNTLFYSTLVISVGMLFLTIVHISIAIYIASSNPKISDFTLKDEELTQEFLNVNIFDKNGNKVYTVVNNDQNRETISLNEVPDYLPQAFIDTEDKNFYYHSGFSIMGYVRAIYYKVIHPNMPLQGGSTLTEQLIKNAKGNISDDTRTLLNKYQELFLSVIIENKYSKDKILEMYLNRIYLGKGTIHGVGTAAKYYFNKDVSDLTLAESAYLAGLPQAPSSYTDNLELGNKRKNTVLSMMKANGSITENQYKRAIQETIRFAPQTPQKQSAFDAYVDYVLKEAKETYNITDEDLKHNGYNIYTYLDPNLQKNMYQVADNFKYTDDNASVGKKVQVSIAAVDPNSHKVSALYGGRGYLPGYENRSYQRYQPGSIIKPLAVYGPAFETGKWTPFSQVLDAKKDFGGYSPKNAENVYEGSITIERALIRSANIPAVTVLNDIGIEKGTDTLEKMGIPIEKNDKQLHVALGGMQKGVTAIEMAQSYATFENYGYFEPANSIKYVKDTKGIFLKKKKEAEKGIDIFSAENAYHMTEILQKVITDPSGTAKNANIGRPLAGKTGTAEEAGTTGNRASWFVGYTPEISMAVHLGFDDPSKTKYLTTPGGGDPAKIFAEIMKRTLAGKPVKNFEKPDDVSALSDGPALTKVKNVNAAYDKNTKQVSITWDKEEGLAGVTYKVYKKAKTGNDILMGTTTSTSFVDKQMIYKKPLQIIPFDATWEEKFLIVFKNAVTTIENTIREKRTYYIVAIYRDKTTEPSGKDSAFVQKN